MSRPEITWSILHPTPLDPAYVARLLKEAENYRVDSLEICGQCHTPYGGLDGLINYTGFPAAAKSWDQAEVAENQRRMNEITSLAHAAGRAVYYFHREVMIPPGLLEDMPDLLDANGEFDLLGNRFRELIAYKVDRAFTACPELDGIVLTLTEADFSAIHNSIPEIYPPEKVVEFVAESFAVELEKRNKRFILRSFGSISEDYQQIIAGAALLAPRHTFEIETKVTPYDFDPYLPANPFLKHSPGVTLSAECDSVGEFMGQGFLPCEQVHHIVRYVRDAQRAGVERYVIRIDRRGHSLFDLYDINFYAYSRAIEDADITAEQIRQEYMEKHYPAEFREKLSRLDLLDWELVSRIYYIDHQVMFHGNYAMKYLKAAFVLSLMHTGKSLQNGRGVWSILTDRLSPGRVAAVREKEEAVAIAKKGLALYESIGCPENYRHHLWQNAVTVSRAALALTRAMAAYFEDAESGNDEPVNLNSAVAAALKEFDELAGHPLQTAKRNVFNGLEHRVNEVNRTLEEVCLEPFAAICKELPAEYCGEVAARKKFLSGCVDGIICGGICDDIRIYRYMHASHAVLHNGYPARWAGNRVFPNGFFEFDLNRAENLCIHGDPAVKEFFLNCDGNRQLCRFDDDGNCTVKLAPGAESVHIRVEKSGRDYPLFYAFSTRA